jgi:hypothetical protein
MPVKFHSMYDSPAFEQGSGQGPVPGADFEHTPAINLNDTGNAADRIRIDEKVLVVVRSHFVVKT